MLFNNLVGVAFFAATGAQALWLATANMQYTTNIGEGNFYGEPFCQVGKGDTEDQATQQASSEGTHSIAIGGIQKCASLPYTKSNQLGGFWNDYGTINYEDSNWHWYCKTSANSLSACDAGNGAPKRK